MVKIKKKQKYYKSRAKVAKALAHWARMMIVDILAEQEELCVCTLTELIDLSQASISKHLAVLKEVGIVSFRKEGLKVFYSLETPCVVDFFDCLDRVLAKDLKRRQKELKDLSNITKGE
ncbi:ArsR family transcriptional regulator [Orenia metallireducens]|uniref:Transcriptional regulator, ArsR family n=1 Tax=Orenia metallireducens TaxID=1413210 RepID=A0A285HHS2_9FIRM|nr:metalloregulator ArsR/SmtB family transcription factor [Orenia metallireducens]PRX27178.1 ArsR family transcriptional regulator [Orenia metallireducens]SNY35153.1 transcriptional regulator, ArsR family [Orenia metallireducens]